MLVEKETGVTLTKEPEGRYTMGGNSGVHYGPVSLAMVPAPAHAVVNLCEHAMAENPQTPHGGWVYHENIIAKSERKQLRISLEVGENDNGSKSPASGFRIWVIPNNKRAEVLKAKGYHYR